MRFETKAIHSGEPRPFIEGSATMPLFLSSVYEYFGEESGGKPRYPRLGNTPNQECLEEKIAALEGGEAALVTGSGMGAITLALLSLIKEGGHLIAQDRLYGGTYHFLHDNFAGFGRSVSFFDARDPGSLRKLLRPDTQGIYVESISNPLLTVPDLSAIAAIARSEELITFIDNTFPSPFNLNPLSLGYDVVLHSATKYMNGHSDIVGGCVISSRERVELIRALSKNLGGSMDSYTCFLLARGLKTLGVRMRWHNDSAMQVARALASHPRVERVLYPGLESHPDHALARKLLRGFGGMIAFEYAGSREELLRCLKRLELPAVATSLGGVESLVTLPVMTSHSGIGEAELARMGIRDTLVRVSIGLEAPEDLISDFLAALNGG